MIFVLLILYQIKHFLADFPLQNEYMLKKFLPGKEFILPLASHCLIHSVITFLITLGATQKLPISLYLAALDFVVHFIMDRIKASPKLLGRFKPLTAKEYMDSSNEQKLHNKYFWWALGLDQGVHHLTHYLLIYLTLSSL